MTVRVRMTVSGVEKLRARYSRRVNFLGSDRIRAHLREMGDWVIDRYERNVASFNPGPVPDLSPGYKKWKKKTIGKAYPILMLTGQMMGSLYRRVFKEDGWLLRVAFAGKHSSGMRNQELARIHIEGDGPPARDFTKLPEGWSRRWLKKLTTELKRL